jgi:hypothetical protein
MSQENEIEAEKPSPTTDFLLSDGASCSASFGTLQDAYLRIITAPWKQATRGPNGCPIIGNANGTRVCMLAHSTNHSDQREEAEANAGLIEAAPRMLKALQTIAGYNPNAMSGYECKEIAAEVLESIHLPNTRKKSK